MFVIGGGFRCYVYVEFSGCRLPQWKALCVLRVHEGKQPGEQLSGGQQVIHRKEIGRYAGEKGG
jgi:hypothetical protein